MKLFQIIISAFTVFIMVAGGCYTTALVALAGQELNHTAMTVCVITGLMASMKDIRATMSLPPLSNGNYEAMSQMMRASNAAKQDLPGDVSKSDVAGKAGSGS